MVTHGGLHDVVVNLILNTNDARPEGWVLTVTILAEDDEVRFTFQDTGVGMSEQTASLVFELFFTTKEDVGSELVMSTPDTDDHLHLFDYHLPKPLSDIDEVHNTVTKASALTEARRTSP